ncbi:STAS domain-containing protein [Streptomyces sp. NPDC005562]|uniref:STAS domain-containing protein n=1 Tax=Streptomyces sp. NPDC005562 TaxID=3154890 RepID=UPI0033A8FE2B
MTQLLTIRTLVGPAGAVIELTGELDHRTAPEVHVALRGLELRPGQQLVLDLGRLTFCDSTGITVFLATRNYALAASAAIVLAAVPARVTRVFRIAGLDEVFPTHPTVEAAEAAWRPAPS